MQLKPGSTIDRYTVEGVLGSGGMAEVYAVRHATLGLPAALKVLRIRSPALAGRLLREGKAQARLQHPNIVRVIDLLEIDSSPALLMERVDGPTLAQVISAGPLSLGRIERIARGLMLGLSAAHALGIVHRDLKPSNVLIAAGDVPRITDFGLATALIDEGEDAGLTRPGTAIGTPAYMAPEQHEDAHLVDTRADIFALGVVLYEMIAGFAPAAGANLLAAWQKMSNKRWRPLSEVVPGTPERIEHAVSAALEPDREARVPSVAALWKLWFGESFPEGGIEQPPESFEGPQVVLARGSHSGVSAIPRVGRTLFGRERELAALRELLESRGTLVTLTGTPGVGKTRLAVAAAEVWRDERRPALWADLQPARDEHDLVRTVAWLLEEDPSRPKEDLGTAAVGRALSRRGPLLLVLDNFEQLPRAAAIQVAQWLSLCPSLRILCTSRQPLDIDVENLIELQPLPVPDQTTEVLRSAAWELFASAAPQGVLDQVDVKKVATLLAALDGLPLALELAAARLEVLALDDLEDRLADRFALLSQPGAEGSRHGALFNAIAWSWSLLRPPEQRALAQLSAFVSPFSLDAAEEIVDAGESTLDLLHALVRRSLIRKTGARFSMLLSVREFAARMLASGPDEGAAFLRHAEHFCARALSCLQDSAVGTARALERLVESVDELGAVLLRAAKQPEISEAALACALGRALVFDQQGPVEGLLRTVDLALALPCETPIAQHRKLELRSDRARAYRLTGDLDAARRELAYVAEHADSPVLSAMAIAKLADITVDGEQAVSLYARAIEIARVHGPTHIVRTSLGGMAQIIASLGRKDEAVRLIEEAYAGLDPRDEYTASELLKAKAYVALTRDDLPTAVAAYSALVDIATRRRMRRVIWYATGQLGIIADARGDFPEALEKLGRASNGVAEDGDPVLSAVYRGYRARVLARLGQSALAESEIASVFEVNGIEPTMRGGFAFVAALAACERGVEGVERWVSLITGDDRPYAPLAVALARGFDAAHRGDRAAAEKEAASVRETIETIDDLPTRALARSLQEKLSGLARAWRIAEDGAFIEPPGAPRIDLQRHAANARIVAYLAKRRAEAPGEPTDACGLAEVGWPGEKIVPSAAANRVRVALSTLRRKGLSELIERVDGGWRLAVREQVQILAR